MKMKWVVINMVFSLALASLLTGSSLAKPSDQPPQQQALEQEALAAHNKWRQLHHVPRLQWDENLQQYAVKHARRCVFKHSSTPYGENLAAGYPSITAAVNAWYAESALYSYRNAKYSPETGHFTQLVWASSQGLGCGYVACNGKNGTPGKYLVCEYSPAGNVVNAGYFKKNVLPV